jgi:lysosomal alpha-glucosidase
MRNALNLRYLLLPYAYTLHYRSHTFGETIARPLFFEFPSDTSTHAIDKQFLFGPALLITPVLEHVSVQHYWSIIKSNCFYFKLATRVDAYFPNATWYDIYTGEKVNLTHSRGTLDAPLTKINVHVRSGYILPMQYPSVTTTERY